MPLLGQMLMYAGLVFGLISVVFLIVGQISRRHEQAQEKNMFLQVGYIGVFCTMAALTLAIAVLVYCFFAGNYTIAYVAEEHSNNTTSLAWLFKLAGVWGGAQGSLLLWTWIMTLYASYIAGRHMRKADDLSTIALAVMGLVIIAFTCVLVFSKTNNPFIATNSSYLDDNGQLVGVAATWGMNALLEHWAMAIHPPTLFIGYAGLTVPFAYAVAALVTGDASKRWVELCNRMTVFAWCFLGMGIGLGAVWAYVVLGWGGYWGWDPVENASLLPWLVGVALIHSFTIYRQRGGFKRWAVFCACLTFTFVILGTFITRSGVVESVHAFNGDNVSLVFFLVLIFVSLLIGIVGIIVRRKSFEASEEIESFTCKNTAYYFSNLVMIVMAVLFAYLTLSSALPTWLPFGGQKLSAATYEALARPIGTVYCLLMAVCPFLSWRKTDGKDFWRNLRWPLLCSVIVFAALLMIYFEMLRPIYFATLTAKGTQASNLLANGPRAYYNGLAIFALFVAAALFCNTLYQLARSLRERRLHTGEKAGVAFGRLFSRQTTRTGGLITHLGMAIVLVGLVGSSMFVREVAVNISADAGSTITCMEYTLKLDSVDTQTTDSGTTESATFKVYRDGTYLTTMTAKSTAIETTQQTKLDAQVKSFPLEDLFVAYQGQNTDGTLSMDVRVNPLISWVWGGFIIMMIGTIIATTARNRRKKDENELSAETAPSSSGEAA